MASAQNRILTFDPATLALWRVAEDGDLEEFASVMRRVADVNARNEHGVTALMRAAQNGHAKMVRALLERGADANIKRNDKFTALALAAFFGHTEVVRTLMEHGADSRASTRSGTSPQMWATARTFNEVANQLEKPLPTKPVAVPNPRVVREAPPSPRSVPLVVRTLKDPPEIWDLVHEEPRGFDARSAFLSRLKSTKTGVAFRVATALVAITMCVVGVLVLRGVQARNERSVRPQPNVSTPVTTSTSAPSSLPAVDSAQSDNASAASATNESAASAPVAPANSDNDKALTPRKFGAPSRIVSAHRIERSATPVAVVETVQPVAQPSEKSEPSARVEVPAKPRSTVPLSPQLITPAKNSAPAKTKVIQWP